MCGKIIGGTPDEAYQLECERPARLPEKGFEDTFNQLDADVFCIQETKMQPGQADFAPKAIPNTSTALRKRAIPAR